MTPQTVLTTLSPLKELPINTLKDLLWWATVVTKHRGERLYTEGEDSDGTFQLVLEGEISILLKAGAPEERGPGTLCGEIALVDARGKRTATVTVTSPSATLLRWNIADLDNEPALIKVLRSEAWPRIVENQSKAGGA